jgi:hypothetical protein
MREHLFGSRHEVPMPSPARPPGGLLLMSGAIHASHPLLVTFIAGDRLHFACSIQRIRRSPADVHGLPAFRAHGMIVSAE